MAKSQSLEVQITKGMIYPCPAHTARNMGSFTTMVLWIVQRFLSLTVYGIAGIFKTKIISLKWF